jgi:hypothetical protein
MPNPVIPQDVQEMTEKYKIDKGGICGQACLAMIEQSTIKEVIDNWHNQGLVFKGWSGWNQLKEYLKNRGYKIIQRNKLESYNEESYYIARVQLIGEGPNREKPFYGWGHWSEASAHTHFITIIKNTWFFCNEDGLFDISDLQAYLKHYDGIITSHMEVFKGMS